MLPLLGASVALAVGSTSCSGCDDYANVGLVVHPVDRTGQLVCVESVTVSDGEYAETLQAIPMETGCAYNGAWERAGDYTINVAITGGSSRTEDATVTKDRCHVKPVIVSIPVEG